jgi:hypothetical protein
LIALSSPTPKLQRAVINAQTEEKRRICDIRGENGTYTVAAMLNTGIAVCSVSGIQFITGIGVNTLGVVLTTSVYQLPTQSIFGWSSTRS